MLENRVLSQPAGILTQVVLGQVETDPAVAVATVESDLNPASRVESFLAMADTMTDTDRAASQRAARPRPGRSPSRRGPGGPGHGPRPVADRWLAIDDLDRATPIIREGRAILDTVLKDRYFDDLEEFAEVLAVIDVAAARAICERDEWKNVIIGRAERINPHLTEAAIRLAAINPAEAERLVPPPPPQFQYNTRDEAVLRICRRMARADLPRAAGFSGRSTGSGPARVFYGLGLMASELAATDPARARELLDEAFTRLRQLADRQDGKVPHSRVPWVMAGLLPVVESLEPDRLEERLWLTAACRAPLPQWPEMIAVQVGVIVAMGVSRYDLGLAAIIMAPPLEHLADHLVESGAAIPSAIHRRLRP